MLEGQREMLAQYTIMVRDTVEIEPKFRHLFSQDKLRNGKYYIRFDFKQIGKEREVQEFLQKYKSKGISSVFSYAKGEIDKERAVARNETEEYDD